MVDDIPISQDKESRRFSRGNSLMLWTIGAILGWIIAIVPVWITLNSTDSNRTEHSGNNEN